MAAVAGVTQVHDLHVWTITSGFPALAAHVLVDRDTDCHATRRELEAMLHERFGLDHTTLQVDHEGGELLQIETGRPGAGRRRGGSRLAWAGAGLARRPGVRPDESPNVPDRHDRAAGRPTFAAPAETPGFYGSPPRS